MINEVRLRAMESRIDQAGGQLPDGLCRDLADLIRTTDVTLALIGSPSRRLTLCASSDSAFALDHWQFTLNEGPCIDAAASGFTTSSSTTGAGVPWPQLAAKASDLGYNSIGGIPLGVGGRIYGAMTVQHSGILGGEQLEDAGEVAVVLAEPIMTQLAEKVPHTVNLADYAVVHQASGMISAQMGVPIDDALAVLRARAWTEGRLLARVAADVVARDIHFDTIDTD